MDRCFLCEKIFDTLKFRGGPVAQVEEGRSNQNQNSNKMSMRSVPDAKKCQIYQTCLLQAASTDRGATTFWKMRGTGPLPSSFISLSLLPSLPVLSSRSSLLPP